MTSNSPWEPQGRETLGRRKESGKAPAGLLVILCLVSWSFLLVSARLCAANPRRSPVVEVVEKVRPAVVNIHSERPLKSPAAPDVYTPSPSRHHVAGMGTGIVIDPRGYIVTNHHVVEDVSAIRIRLSDGSTHNALVVARDHDVDLALLKIDAGRPLPTVPLGTARDLMVGETVIAIGNAYGYEHTVTVGVVSAVNRDVTLNKETAYKALIQTDASINPGNSGGPLLNVNGEMVGVNVAIRAGAQGISFAIPVDTMIRAAADMLSVQKRSGLWHGLVCRDRLLWGDSDLQLQSAKGELASDHETKADPPAWKRELVVERVDTGSPSARAGLQAGDVVVRLADQAVASSLDLERALIDHAAGERLPVVVRRTGDTRKLELALQPVETAATGPAELVWRKLGLRLQAVNAELVSRVSPQLHGGLVVVDLSPNGVAERSGIQRGDVLVGLHQWETLSVDNVGFVLTHPELASFSPLSFYIVRAGLIRRGYLQGD
jgi:serine protease Do